MTVPSPSRLCFGHSLNELCVCGETFGKHYWSGGGKARCPNEQIKLFTPRKGDLEVGPGNNSVKYATTIVPRGIGAGTGGSASNSLEKIDVTELERLLNRLRNVRGEYVGLSVHIRTVADRLFGAPATEGAEGMPAPNGQPLLAAIDDVLGGIERVAEGAIEQIQRLEVL